MATRSRTGWKRKLKCDEKKPLCGQCVKAKRECQQSAGITFRHQQNASMNGEGADGPTSDRLKTFFSYRNTFTQDHIWVPIPPQVFFVHIKDPYVDTEMDGRDAQKEWEDLNENNRGLETLSTVATDFNHFMPLSSGASSAAPVHTHRYSASPGSATLSTPSVRIGPSPQGLDGHSPVDPHLMNRDVRAIRASLNLPDELAETDHEVAFLLRHYAEAPGYSMDLFDCGRYFSFHVPIKARMNPLLKYAACAYAAKHILLAGGKKPIVGGGCSVQARMELWPEQSEKPNWEFVGAKYYAKALSNLSEAIMKLKAEAARVESESGQPGSGYLSTPDELLAAAAILCEFEAMDSTRIAWSGHLNGVFQLLNMAEQGMSPSNDPALVGQPQKKLFAGARKAIFWNFARQDFAAAYITECQTRLNVNNFPMWRAAGLDLDERGCLLPNSNVSRFGNDTHSPEDMIANSMILLLSKLNNYVTAGESVITTPGAYISSTITTDEMSGTSLGISQQTLLGRWNLLREEIDTWFKNLPDTFNPSARIEHPVFSEIWYSIPMVASAMQSYHMARVILLTNKPHEATARRTTVTSRLKSYEAINAETKYHAREICGIALSRPESAVRIFSIQPLFVSGQCLTDTMERRVVLDLLRGIEKDLGWRTEYRVQQLLNEWEWRE